MHFNRICHSPSIAADFLLDIIFGSRPRRDTDPHGTLTAPCRRSAPASAVFLNTSNHPLVHFLVTKGYHHLIQHHIIQYDVTCCL